MASAGAVFYGAFLIAFEQPMGKLLGLALIAASFLGWNIGWRVALGRRQRAEALGITKSGGITIIPPSALERHVEVPYDRPPFGRGRAEPIAGSRARVGAR